MILSVCAHLGFFYILGTNKTKKKDETETAEMISSKKSYVRFTYLDKKKTKLKKISKNDIKILKKDITAKNITTR